MNSDGVDASRPAAKPAFLQAPRRRNEAISAELEGEVVGSVVLNRFVIERRIGSGGFGVVYEAWDGRLERPVAVKAIDPGGDAGCKRVLREAQAAARLNHPGIVTLYEMGEEDGSALLVTELVDGATLERLNRDGTLSDREIGEIAADLCEALDHAHSRSVVHRDIKPQNVLITAGDEPRAKLMDFGVARLTDAAALTAPGDVVGTLAYMAPEQAEGLSAGPEADVYSLALTLYECWSGENPNRRTTPAATARAIGARHRPLRRVRPDLPAELTDAVDACLQPRPGRRPSLEELGNAIEDSLEQLSEAPPGHTAHPLFARLGVAAAAAALGVWLAAGHGVPLP
jgi:eukaryotic-like serine/threonine-protein kinase